MDVFIAPVLTLTSVPGPIGLAILLNLQAQGIDKILISEPSSARATNALDFGATRVLNPRVDDVARISKTVCEGLGPHVVFDCAGVQASVTVAFDAVRVKGTIVNLAVWRKPAVVDVNLLLSKQILWMGSAVYKPGVFRKVIDAISSGECCGPPREMVTACYAPYLPTTQDKYKNQNGSSPPGSPLTMRSEMVSPSYLGVPRRMSRYSFLLMLLLRIECKSLGIRMIDGQSDMNMNLL